MNLQRGERSQVPPFAGFRPDFLELPIREGGEIRFTIHPTVAEHSDANFLEFVPRLDTQLFRGNKNELWLTLLGYAVNQQLTNSGVDTRKKN
jgi:hypothetical protein